MSYPWFPPSFGESWEELLHNPFIGSGYPHIGGGSGYPYVVQSSHHRRTAGPDPSPWLVYLSTLKVAASTMPEGPSRSEFEGRIAQTMTAFLDDYCGTPWPGHHLPPWVLTIVSELTLIANTLHEGGLRNEIVSLVGQIMQRAIAPQRPSE